MKALVNGSVWVGGNPGVRSEAIGISGERIVAVGTSADVVEGMGPGVEVMDLEKRFVSAGFQDAHVHPADGGMQRMQCDLSGCTSAKEALAAIAAYVAGHPEVEFVQGGGWLYPWFEGGNPEAHALDAVTGGVPTYLTVADGHSGWANQAALRLAGIQSSTPDPSDGRIVRNEDGSPQGTLHEGAMALVERIVPSPSPDELREGLLAGQSALFEVGVTSWQDAWVNAEIHELYRSLAISGELRASVRGALWWDRERGLEQLDDLIELSREGHERYDPRTIKLMLDGVCENHTAAMLDPYTDRAGRPTDNSGLDFIDPQDLPAIVTAIDAAGLQCHFHALGDRAVRNALDAIEAARYANGPTDLRHHIAHLQVVHPDDVSRFGSLGVTANLQPLWACADEAVTELTLPFLQEPQRIHQYPFAALARRTNIAMGSDWPVSSPDVMAQVAVAATRAVSEETLEEAFLPDQKLDYATSLKAFTSGSAYVNHLDHETGVIAPGFRADLVILDQDPFGLAWTGGIAVDMTLVGGEIVHHRDLATN
ncbi:MAG: amidohydrolase [Acidimicrobiia bacterium]|nr:amidohydrolase [Acidimicrobiia bacterium]